MLYNRIYHTDAPYPLIKTFFDPREKQTFVSPKKMEEDFFPGHIDPTTKQLISSGLTEYIPADYLDRFSLFLQIIRKKIDSLVKKQKTSISFPDDSLALSFKTWKRLSANQAKSCTFSALKRMLLNTVSESGKSASCSDNWSKFKPSERAILLLIKSTSLILLLIL